VLQTPSRRERLRPARLCWLAVLVCACLAGCVQRRLTIRSNPPGALVYVDDYQIGTTPVSTDFVYYGTRKIRLSLSGYETLTVLQPIPTPWYQYPGLDFISENVVPGEIRDERVVEFQLQPQIIVPSQQLLDRAENLRNSTAAPRTPLAPRAVPPGMVPPGMVAPGAAPQTAAPTLGPPPAAPPGVPASPPSTSRWRWFGF